MLTEVVYIGDGLHQKEHYEMNINSKYFLKQSTSLLHQNLFGSLNVASKNQLCYRLTLSMLVVDCTKLIFIICRSSGMLSSIARI